MKPIALQLYTVREAAARDFPAALRRVAEIGYKGVELAGFHGHQPQEIAAIIKDLGLQVSSSHTTLPTKENVQQIVDQERTLGSTKIISGFGPDQLKTPDMCRQAARQFQEAAEMVRPHGLEFGMHNHWWEFEPMDGSFCYDIIMKDAPGIFSELDVYWTAISKVDPVAVIQRYGSRLPLLHIKDGDLVSTHNPHTAVGSGVLDMPAIIGAANPAVLEWLIVELDEYSGDMFEAVEKSYNYLTSNGLAAGNK